jgi:hypothetical protein
MPYHNMRAAHKRLLQKLPADSLYRQTVARSVWRVIADLWQRASKNSRRNATRRVLSNAHANWHAAGSS